MSVALELDHDDSVLSAHIARSRATKSTLASRPSVSKCCGVRVVPEVAPTVVTPAWWAVIASAYPSAMTALPASKLGLQVRRSADEQPPARLLRSRQARRLPHVDQLLFPPVVIA